MSEANETFSMQADTAVDNNGSSRITHFDATQKRRQRMRQHAEGENGKSAARPAAPTKAASNGAGTAGQASSGSPVVQAGPKVQAAPVVQAGFVGAPSVKPPAPAVASSFVQAASKAVAAAPKPVVPAPAQQNGPAKAGTPTASAAPAKTLDPQELEKFLIKFVVEQTGYPEEMVELDADLEADLGIDSIKKAQLFAEMGEHLDVQVEINESMSLDDFPTLRHVKDFLQKQPVGEKGQGVSLSPQSQAVVQAVTNTAPVGTAGQASSGTPVVQAAPKVQPAPVVQAGNGAATHAARPVQTFAPVKAVTPIAPAKAGTPTSVAPKAVPAAAAATPGWVSPDPNVIRPQMTAPMSFPATAARVAAPAASAKENAPAKAGTPTESAPAKTLDPQELEKFLISFVVEQTGYPEEMVELDADLEADLGIDSIKKAQLFAEMGEHLDVQVEINENMSLDDFPTLRHVMEFLQKQPVGTKGQGATLAPQSQAVVQAVTSSSPVPVRTAGQASSGTPVVQAAPKVHAAVKPQAVVQAGNGAAGQAARPVQTFAPPKAAAPVAPAAVVRPVSAVKPIAPAVAQQSGPAKAGTPAGSAAKPAAAFPSPAAARPATNAAMSFPAAAKPAPTNGAANTSGSAAASGPALSSADLEKFLISFVVEQTGYPEEMVELDADLEADLGIDSIKKAQLFAEMGEHLDVQVEISEDMSLDDFPTLRHVMEFLMKQPSGTKGQGASLSSPISVRTAGPASSGTPIVQAASTVQAGPKVQGGNGSAGPASGGHVSSGQVGGGTPGATG